MKNQRGHRVCWMSTSRKNGLAWRTHTMQIEQRRVEKSIGWPGDVYFLSSLQSWNFAQISQQGICMWFTQELVRTETENTIFPTIFLRNCTSRKKRISWWWCSWRSLKSFSCIYSEYIEWWKGSKMRNCYMHTRVREFEMRTPHPQHPPLAEST